MIFKMMIVGNYKMVIKEVEKYLQEMIVEGKCDKAHEQQMRVILMRRFLEKFPHRRETVERPILDRSPGKPNYGYPW